MHDFAAQLERTAVAADDRSASDARRRESYQRRANRAAANLVLLSCGERVEYVGRGSVESSERLWIRILTKLARRGVRPDISRVDEIAEREMAKLTGEVESEQ